MKNIDIALLRRLLCYEPETGKLYWLERPVEMFEDGVQKTAEQLCSWWNGRFAGKEAFTAKGVYGCRTGRIFGQTYYAHRVAWALHFSAWPPHDIDHEDGNRSNNRIHNLRAATHQMNMQNKKLYSSNSSGCHGVSFTRRTKRWQAYITVNRKRRHIGYFDTQDAAIAARQTAERETGAFHVNHGRAA